MKVGVQEVDEVRETWAQQDTVWTCSECQRSFERGGTRSCQNGTIQVQNDADLFHSSSQRAQREGKEIEGIAKKHQNKNRVKIFNSIH